MLPAQLGGGSQTVLSQLEERKVVQHSSIWCHMWLNKVHQTVVRQRDLRFVSGDDMNMTAMSKRLTLARLLRTSSVTAGASFLHKTGVNIQYKPTCAI